jgi:hypothetical protein
MDRKRIPIAMKKILFAAAISLTILMSNACDDAAQGEPTTATATLNAPFVLKSGQKAEVSAENVQIMLSSIDDSRCPSDGVCVWAGEVVAKVEVAIGGTSYGEFTLKFQESGQILPDHTVYVENYSITISKVLPYPKSMEEIKKEDYRITFEIAKI